jgi:hypothetical protein
LNLERYRVSGVFVIGCAMLFDLLQI